MADNHMLPWGGQHPSIIPSEACIREQRRPRGHYLAQLVQADWDSIRLAVIRLENRVQRLVYGIQTYKQNCRPDDTRYHDLRVNYVSTPIIAEMIHLAQSLREHREVLMRDLANILRNDGTSNGGTGLAHHWVGPMFQWIRRFQVRNRTLHVEQYWIRILISITPWYLSIDYHTLTWNNDLDCEDCAHITMIELD